MPAAFWDTYRVGARIPSLDGLLGEQAAKQIGRLQQALSSVAYMQLASLPVDVAPPTADDVFVGRLLLGMLCRGWPAFSSPMVEQALLESVESTAGLYFQKTPASGEVGWKPFITDAAPRTTWEDAIRGATLRGDSRLEIDDAIVEMLTDSESERHFYKDYLARLFGPAIGWVELQRPLASMIREDAPDPNTHGAERVDYALEIPGSTGPIRLAIELDGPHHKKSIDRKRDDLLRNHGWGETRRIPVKSLDDGSLNYLPGAIKAIIKGNPFPFTLIEEESKALADSHNREAVRLVLTPHAIARVQLALCLALLDGTLHLAGPDWTIAIVEREVPCAQLAVQDLIETLTHLCRLYGIPVGLKQVHLLLAEEHLAPFTPQRWHCSEGTLLKVDAKRLVSLHSVHHVDLAIDVSIGAHPTRRYKTDPLSEPNLVITRRVALRTAHRQSGYRIHTWPEPREISDPSSAQTSLRYFLQLLFRKHDFRPGQLPILERVLQRKDVIGLLPTGAGKSITFQLPALLSPGLSLVIDPLKSLMQDQVENLAQVGITDAIQINSDTPPKERPKIEWQFSQGEYRLVFISPERLQVKNFRDRLKAAADKRPIAYVVIDEAHCVSEWGHDFRTAYLNLGRIATDYCGRSGDRPPMAALTGTASEPVLRDIRRELDVEADDAIIRPSNFARDELRFEIVPVSKEEKASKLVHLIGSVIPEKLGVEPDVLASGACGGIVFCPHVNRDLGVFEVAENISRRLPAFSSNGTSPTELELGPVGFYSGEPPKRSEISDQLYPSRKASVQRAFKFGRMPLLVATSAFGMGIDKPNIRYTVHYAMSKSVEAFAQEAGRAGRDRKTAICAVLFTDRLARTDGGKAPPADCLELGIPVEDARHRAATSGWGSDDAEVQMYLHSRGYQGVLREAAAVRAFYQEWVRPHLPSSAQDCNQIVEVTVDEDKYRETIEDLIAPLMTMQDDPAADSEDRANREVNGQEEALPKPDLQRLVYRLSLLGIVTDYTVVYRPGDNVYTLTARAMNAGTVEEHLYRYVARYRLSDRKAEVEKRLASSPHNDPVSRCIETLCWFIYDEIEQRRRQGLRDIREMLRNAKDGADFAEQLNDMLSYTALTQAVFDVLAADDYRAWGRISNEISAAETAQHVYYQCLRALEDAPGHPGLTLLLGLALQGAEEDRGDEVVDTLRYGLRQVRRVCSLDDQRGIADWLVSELARIGPSATPDVLTQILERAPDTVLAGTVLRRVRTGAIPADSVLVRTSERCLLKGINDRLDRFMQE